MEYKKPSVEVLGSRLNGMNVLLSTEVIVQESDNGPSTYEIFFDEGITLSFIFHKITHEQKKTMPSIEEVEESKDDPNLLKLRIRYADSDNDFGIIESPVKLFIRRIRKQGDDDSSVKTEQVYFNFILEKKLGDSHFFKLLVLSK